MIDNYKYYNFNRRILIVHKVGIVFLIHCRIFLTGHNAIALPRLTRVNCCHPARQLQLNDLIRSVLLNLWR